MDRTSIPTETLTRYIRSVRQAMSHPMAGDAGLLAASQYFSAGLGFVTAVVAARFLGPADYGVAALVIAYPTLLWSFISVKTLSVTTRYIANYRATGQTEELKSICKLGYGLDLFLSLVAFILIVATGDWVGSHLYNMSNVAWLMVVYAVSLPFMSFVGTSWAILSSWGQFRWLAFSRVLNRGVTLSFAVFFLSAGFGIPGFVWAMALGQVVFGIVALSGATYLLFRDGLGLWWRASFSHIVNLRQELTSFFGWNYLMVTLSGLLEQVPLMLLGRIKGPEEAGFYRLATSFTTVGGYLEGSLGRVSYPILSTRWGSGERESIKNSLKRWTLWGGVPIFIVVALVILVFPALLPLMFGHDFRPMIRGTQVMMTAVAISALFFWLSSYYYASGKISLWTKAYGLYTLYVLCLSWPFIQAFGFFGLAFLIAGGKVAFTLSLAAISFSLGKNSS